MKMTNEKMNEIMEKVFDVLRLELKDYLTTEGIAQNVNIIAHLSADIFANLYAVSLAGFNAEKATRQRLENAYEELKTCLNQRVDEFKENTINELIEQNQNFHSEK